MTNLHPIPTRWSFQDLTGKKFSRWTVIEYLGQSKGRFSKWHCVCDCGTYAIVLGNRLKNGRSKSCGCLHKENRAAAFFKHGFHSKSEYNSWRGMIDRCYNEQTPSYKDYGGRGITVCDRWNKIENFIKDMGEKPSKLHTLDRKDNNKGYSPENCRWATKKQQARNRRNNVFVLLNGKRVVLSEACELFGVDRHFAIRRILAGDSIESIFK